VHRPPTIKKLENQTFCIILRILTFIEKSIFVPFAKMPKIKKTQTCTVHHRMLFTCKVRILGLLQILRNCVQKKNDFISYFWKKIPEFKRKKIQRKNYMRVDLPAHALHMQSSKSMLIVYSEKSR